MVWIISVLNPHPHPFLRIWYELLGIQRIWMRMWILDKRISDENVRGYGIDNIRCFLRIIRHSQIGLSIKFSLLCHAIIYIAYFRVLLLLIINLLGCLWIIVTLCQHKLMYCMNMSANLDVI